MLRFALYVSNHGFGHSTRISALAEEFIKYGIFCHIISTKPAYLFQNLDPHYFIIHQRSVDVGVKHNENLTVDMERTVSSLLELLSKRNEIIAREVKFLHQEKIDCVIADVPFLVSEFGAYCRLPVYAVTNFEWHYIYSSLLTNNNIMNSQAEFTNPVTLRPVLNLIWSLYQRFDACFQLPFSSSESISAFKNNIPCGLLSRKKDSYSDIRLINNWDKDVLILLVIFGGEGKLELDYEALCSAFKGVVISTQTGVQAKNHYQVTMDADFLDLIYNADFVLCKPGYSTLAEAVQMNKFIIYCPRKKYPEETVLIQGLSKYSNCLQIDTLQMNTKQWKAIFESIHIRKQPVDQYKNNNINVAGSILKKYAQMIGNNLVSVFDLGSNNLNYLLYSLDNKQIIHKTQLTTSLGKDFKNDKLSAKRLQSVKQIIESLLQFDGYIESKKVLLATGVMRKALNANLLTDWIEKHYEIKSKIISQEEEIRYVYYAARHFQSGEEAYLAIDIGGFSTEFIDLGNDEKIQGIGLPFGLMTLLNEFDVNCDTATKYIQDQLATLTYNGSYHLIGVGLTYTYLAAVIFKFHYNDIDKMEGKTITRSLLQQLFHSIEVKDEDRYLPFLLEESYLPVLKLSILFIISLLDRFNTSEIIVCNSGIAVGYANWLAKTKNKALK